MSDLSWSLLNLAAWAFGLKAAYDLRAEFPPLTRTWAFLTWAVWACLLMEVAMIGARAVPGLGLFSAVTGIVSACYLLLAFRSLAAGVRPRAGTPADTTTRAHERAFATGGVASLAVTVSLGYAWPTATAGLTAGATVAEGLLWLVISAGLAVAAARKPDAPQTADVSMPRGLALAFSLAFLGAAVTPVAWLTGWTPDAAIVHLLRALFVFALVTTLYGMVLRTRSARLVAATTRLQQIQEQFAGVEKLVAVGTLAAGAAHDFNNSLTVILSRAELLALNPAELSASARAHVDAIEKSARAAATVTRNLLGIARRQGGTQLYGGLAEMLEVPLESLRREFARRRITVETRFDPVPTPPVDLGLLVQVFLNLYLNARDAMIATGGGTLRVSMRHIGGEIEIAVADSGTGVPESFRDRIFQPLQTTKGAGGTGLGLSVSKAMLESMGGTIRYDSREGHGSTFYVTLPAAAAGATASPAQAVA